MARLMSGSSGGLWDNKPLAMVACWSCVGGETAATAVACVQGLLAEATSDAAAVGSASVGAVA